MKNCFNNSMKIINQDLVLNKSKLDNNSPTLKKIATTDINVLLNRVKLDEKRDFIKKLISIGLLLITISFFTIFAIV